MGPVTLPVVASVEDGEAVMWKSLTGGGGPEPPPQAPSSAANQTTLSRGFDSVRGTGFTAVKAPTIRQFAPPMRKKCLVDLAAAGSCEGLRYSNRFPAASEGNGDRCLINIHPNILGTIR